MPYASQWEPGKVLHYHLLCSDQFGKMLVLGVDATHGSVVVLIIDNPFDDNMWRVKAGQAHRWVVSDEGSTATYHFANECPIFARDLT